VREGLNVSPAGDDRVNKNGVGSRFDRDGTGGEWSVTAEG
jgi:hypothetical protein